MVAFFILKINLVGIVTDPYLYRMENEFKRKEVILHEDVVKRLQKLADAKKWSLKLYMETVLVKDSNKGVKK